MVNIPKTLSRPGFDSPLPSIPLPYLPRYIAQGARMLFFFCLYLLKKKLNKNIGGARVEKCKRDHGVGCLPV